MGRSKIEILYIKGVGPFRAKILAECGIKDVDDLINYFPRSYIDRSVLKNIRALKESLMFSKELVEIPELGEFKISSEVSVIARVIAKRLHSFGKKEMLKLTVSDTSDELSVIFWNKAKYFDKVYNVGDLLIISGVPEFDKFKKLSFTHPDIDVIDKEDEELFKSGTILPKYKISDKMLKGKISQKIMRTILRNLFDSQRFSILETLPHYILSDNQLQSLEESVLNLHFPTNRDLLDASLKRMKFDEIFYYSLNVLLMKTYIQNQYPGIVITEKSKSARLLYDKLPFELTKDQKKALKEIAADFSSGKPMNRLLQGDVGSGKTIVSIFSILMILDAGFQCLIMAPTEILAEQHFKSISKFLIDFDFEVLLLTGSTSAKLRKEHFEKISLGKRTIIVGTHALFQSEVKYTNLGLIIIDEQQRFGVQQRSDLIVMGRKSFQNESMNPHILVLSATPIPRTLSMTIYGDLDISLIKTMPKNRKPIITRVGYESNRAQIYDFIRNQINKGYQSFIIYPFVNKSEKLEFKAATDHFESLANEIFPEFKLGLVHGQMSGAEKDMVMNAFLKKEYHILVATTVIEVGIDIANANLILIEDAHKFGLSQLHQLRGRVGRSDLQSYCFLMTKDYVKYFINKNDDELSEAQTSVIRLRTMQNTTDGFEIAEVDMKLRGPGDILGTKQSGLPEFKFFDLVYDTELIIRVKKICEDLLISDPDLSKPKHKIIKDELLFRFEKNKTYYNIA